MNSKFSYKLILAHSAAARSRSRYSGGFTTVNGRLNNSSAYNHDYYTKNKEKWKDNRDSSSSKRGDIQEKLKYYEDLGEEAMFGDWSPEKFQYVLNNPDYRKMYEKYEETERDEDGLRMLEKVLDLGDEYDKANGTSSSNRRRAFQTRPRTNTARAYRENYYNGYKKK